MRIHTFKDSQLRTPKGPGSPAVCQALTSFFVIVCVSPSLGGLTSWKSAGNNLRGSTNKTSFGLDLKKSLVFQSKLGHSKYNHKKTSSFTWGWIVLCLSFHVSGIWEDGLHSAQISQMSSLHPLMPQYVKPWTTRAPWVKLKESWSVSCYDSYMSHEMCEGWLCCFVYNISRAVASNGWVLIWIFV